MRMHICDALYNGLQFPESWIHIYNSIMIYNGYTQSPVNVPVDIINESHTKYFNMNPTISHHHSSTDFPPLSSLLSNPHATQESPLTLFPLLHFFPPLPHAK